MYRVPAASVCALFPMSGLFCDAQRQAAWVTSQLEEKLALYAVEEQNTALYDTNA